MDIQINIPELVKLRRTLHQQPELSGKEKHTAETLKAFLQRFQPDELIENLGGHGVAAVFNGKSDGPVVLFRCDLDALPIQEENSFDYRSEMPGIAHKCGHDGHMSIITGLAEAISMDRPEKGKVVLLYQPSEENGMGAERVINDPQYTKIQPDFVYALHNLPGFPKGSIVTNFPIFASASRGMIIRLFGKTSHAGEPENGRSPGIAMAELVKDLTYLPRQSTYDQFVLVTVIHARLGEIAFGTTPGYAEVMATLRSYTNEDMKQLTEKASERVKYHTEKSSLQYEVDWTEEFLATENAEDAVDVIEKAAKENHLEVIRQKEPFRWSEDFSHFTQKHKGALFGLGAGEDTPQLHNPDYDFPEDIIEPGIKTFYGIYKHHFNKR